MYCTAPGNYTACSGNDLRLSNFQWGNHKEATSLTHVVLWKKLRAFFKKAVRNPCYPSLFLLFWSCLLGVFLPSVGKYFGLFLTFEGNLFLHLGNCIFTWKLLPLISKFESCFPLARRLIKVVLNHQTSLFSRVITWMGGQRKIPLFVRFRLSSYLVVNSFICCDDKIK